MRSSFIALGVFVGLSFGCGGGDRPPPSDPVSSGNVKITGVHLCCDDCVKGVVAALQAVDGVTDITCDRKSKTVTFATRDRHTGGDQNLTIKGIKALNEAGYFGKATDSGKEVGPLTVVRTTGTTDEVTLQGVHVCCKQCQDTIDALFKDARVTYTAYPGEGAKKEVKVNGKDLKVEGVLETLQRAGFTGMWAKRS